MSVIEKDDFIQKAERGEWKSLCLGFDNCINLEIEGENLNQTICDFFNFRQKTVPSIIEFHDFVKNIKYFMLRGCKIKAIKYEYKGWSPWRWYKTWCRVKVLKRFQKITKENNNG